MPVRPAITLLPKEILDELNTRLIDSGFSDYKGLEKWLKQQGFSISKTAVWNHGYDLQAKMEKSMQKARERMEIAKALRGASDDEKAALMEANEMIAMDKIMEQWDNWDSETPEQRAKMLPTLVRAIADLNRSAIGSAKWKREFEAEIRKQAAQEAANTAAKTAKEMGVSEETIKRIRMDVLGMAA